MFTSSKNVVFILWITILVNLNNLPLHIKFECNIFIFKWGTYNSYIVCIETVTNIIRHTNIIALKLTNNIIARQLRMTMFVYITGIIIQVILIIFQTISWFLNQRKSSVVLGVFLLINKYFHRLFNSLFGRFSTTIWH